MGEMEEKRHFELAQAHIRILQHQSPRAYKDHDQAQVKLVDVLARVARAMGVNSGQVYAWELHAREDWPDIAPQPAPFFDTDQKDKPPVDTDGVGG
jgi:hypothetical protein